MTIAQDAAQPEAARVELVRRYLTAFGPATRADVSEWSGLRVRDLEPALASLEPLERFRDERGRELVDLPRAPRPSANTPAPLLYTSKTPNTTKILETKSSGPPIRPTIARRRGIRPEIARRKTEHGSGLGRYRWVVERTFAWLHQFKRLLVRYDRRADIHEAFLALGCCLVCYRRLTKNSL